MKVFAYYDSSPTAPAEQSELVTLWERSWRNRGWTPRLISERHAKRSRFFKQFPDEPRLHPLLALQASGGGLLVPMYVMNFGFEPTHDDAKLTGTLDKFPFEIYRGTGPALVRWLNDHSKCRTFRSGVCAGYETSRWATSPLVFFSNPKKILTCGRTL